MPTRRKTTSGMVPARHAGAGPAGLRMSLPAFVPGSVRGSVAGSVPGFVPGIALALLLTGCATLTESTEQYVMVQTVLDHQPVAGIGCVLSNDSGRWFVTSPGRVRIRKSTKPLAVDCRLNDVYAIDQVGPKQNSSLWGNILLTAGTGVLVDRQTGAGFDYPSTLTVLLKQVPPAPPPAPAAPAPVPAPVAPPPAPPPQPPGGSDIY